MDPHANSNDLPWELLVSALQGELSPDEEISLRQWLSSSAAHQESYDRLNRLWQERMADYPMYAEADEKKAWLALQQKMLLETAPVIREPTERGSTGMGSTGMGSTGMGSTGMGSTGRSTTGGRIWIRQLASMAAILVLAILGWWYFAKDKGVISYETAAGEKKNVSLKDGSEVILQPNTKIELVPGYNRADREVRLIAGTAHFEVIHQENKPFVVETDAAEIKDIGTGFTVEKSEDSIKVTVTSGRIAFTKIKTGESRVVSTGSTICLYTGTFHPGELKQSGSGAGPLDTLSGRPDSLRFANTPLSEVLTALEKHSGKRIRLNDPALGQQRITVHLAGESLENSLHVICTLLNLEYELKDGTYLLRKKG